MIEIREMTIADYDDAIALWQTTEGMGLSAADTREAIARYLARNPGMSFVARGEDGSLAGAVLCGHDGRRGYLHHLAVHTACRGQGLGSQLAGHCLAALRAEARPESAGAILAALQAEGIDKCHLFVKRDNPSGQSFWEKTGWYERTDLVLMSIDI
jgi:ribosomal protein S18 acetylase RimI-like enzyme